MKILVLGGTGPIGSHVVQILGNNGVEVVVTSRSPRSSTKLVKYLMGNAHDYNFLLSILNTRWDAIIDFMSYSSESFKERVEQILQATSQYVFLSSARVYADSKEALTEGSPRLLEISRDEHFLETDEYALAKARQEDILLRSRRRNWTIIRPYVTYDERRLPLGASEKEGWLYRALHGRTIVLSKDVDFKTTTLTHGLDVGRGIVSMIGRPEALGETVQIAAKRAVHWRDVLELYLTILEKHLRYRPKVLLLEREEFEKCHAAIYQLTYDRMYDRRFDSQKCEALTGIVSYTDVEMGLTTCLTRFLQRPVFKEINWKTEAEKDKWAKERTPMREIPGVRRKIRYLRYRYCRC